MRRKFLAVALTFLLLFIFVTPSKMIGQADQQRKFSISLFSGTSFAGTGTVLGNFDVSSSSRHIIGGSLLYNTSPRWSVEANIHAGKLINRQETDLAFENDFVAFAFRGVGDLNNLLNFGPYANNRIHPYFSAGMGIFLSSVEASDLSTNDFALGFNGGPGIAYRVNPWFDFFAQYDFYFLGTDLVDGFSDESGSDQYAVLKTGIRFNFGKTRNRQTGPETPFTGAQSPEPHEDEEPETDVLPEPQMVEPESLQPALNFETLSGFASFYLGPLMNRTVLSEMRTALEEKRRLAEAARVKAEQEANRNRILKNSVENGHYIQIRSLPGREEALIFRNFASNSLQGILTEPDNLIIVTPFQNTHRVLIGPFKSIAEARAVQRETEQVFEGSFAITYPRESDRAVVNRQPSPPPQTNETVETSKPEPEPRPAPEQTAAPEISANVPDGQYIQVRSIPNRNEALQFRMETIGDISGKIPDAANKVWATPFRDTFRILIGPFNSYAEARSARQRIGSAYEGAFVITYPRAN